MAAPVISAVVVTLPFPNIQAAFNTDIPAVTQLHWGPIDPRGVGTALNEFYSVPGVLGVVHLLFQPTVYDGVDNTYYYRIRATDPFTAEYSEVTGTVSTAAAPAVAFTLLRTEPLPESGDRIKYLFTFTLDSAGVSVMPKTWTSHIEWSTTTAGPWIVGPNVVQITAGTVESVSATMDLGALLETTDPLFFRVFATVAGDFIRNGIQELYVVAADSTVENLRLHATLRDTDAVPDPYNVEAFWTFQDVTDPLNPGRIGHAFSVCQTPAFFNKGEQIFVMPLAPLFSVDTPDFRGEPDGKFKIAMENGLLSIPGLISSTIRVVDGGTHHAAFTWDGEFVELFLNGRSVARIQSDFQFTANIDLVEVGGSSLDSLVFQGWIGSVRVSETVRAITEFNYRMFNPDPFAFTPTGPVATDANTRLLLLLNGNLLDTSGNAFNASSPFAPVYGGPPLGLDGVTTPAFYPEILGNMNLAVVPNVALQSLPQGTIEFWFQWVPEQSPNPPIKAPHTAKEEGLRMEEPRYFQVSQVRQEQSYQINATPDTYIAFPQPDNTVNASVVFGDFLYIGGSFLNVDGNLSSRMARIDLRTNALDLGWIVFTDAPVNDIIIDGDDLYIGGDFALVNGSPMDFLAKLDRETGLLDLSWDADIIGVSVNRLAQDAFRIFFGGLYGSVHGVPKNGITAVAKSDGSLIMAATPTLISVGTLYVLSILVDQSKNIVYFGGNFAFVDGSPRGNAAAFDFTTGALLPWDPASNGSVTSLAATQSIIFIGGIFSTLSGAPRGFFGSVDFLTGAVTAAVMNHNASPVAARFVNNYLYMAGLFSLPTPGFMHVYDPASSSTVPTFNKAILGGVVFSFDFYQDTVIFGGTFASILGHPQTFLARAFDSTVMQNIVDPIISVPTDAEHLFADAPAQLQQFSRAEGPNRDFSWRKARPLQEEEFRIQWAADPDFTLFLNQVLIPRVDIVNISGQPVPLERAVVQDTDNQTLGAYRRKTNPWSYRGRSEHPGYPFWLPVYPGYTGLYSNVAETSVELHGTIGYFISANTVGGLVTVQSADDATTFLQDVDYTLTDGFLARTTGSLILDGSLVHVTYQRTDSLTVRANIRMLLREYFNALLPEKFYDRDSRTTNFFKLQDIYGLLFGDVQLNLDQLGYQDRFLETSALNDNPPRYSNALTLTTQGNPFNVAWTQQAARGMIGATRVGGTRQAARISARSYTGQACDIDPGITGFYIIDDLEDPEGTPEDPDFYVGSDVAEVIKGPFVTVLGIVDAWIIPLVQFEDPGLIDIFIEDDDVGLVWVMNVWDASYDFNTKSVRNGAGLIAASMELTFLGTTGIPPNVLTLNLGVQGVNDTELIDSPLEEEIIGNAVGGTVNAVVPGAGTPLAIGTAIAAALVTQINDPLNVSLSTFFEASNVSNVLTIKAKILGPAGNDFSAIPTSLNVTVSSTNPLNLAGYLEFQGGASSKSFTSIANYVDGTVSVIDKNGVTVPTTAYVVNATEGSIAFIAAALMLPADVQVNDEFSVVGKAYMGDVVTKSRLVIDALKNVMPAYATAGFVLHQTNPVDQQREWGVAPWGVGAWGGKHRLYC